MEFTRNWLKRIVDAKYFVPIVLFVMGGISYGIFIPLLGYYGDDWSMAWLAYRSHHLENFFLGNRPFLAYYYQFLTSFIGPAPWQWQVFAVFCRWLGAVLFWYLIVLIWPQRREIAGVAAILLLLYPGFWLSGESMTLNLAFLQMAILFGSFIATIYSARRPKKCLLWTVLAFIGAFLNLFLSEYWFFIELLRPLLLVREYSTRKKEHKEILRKTLFQSVPFIAIFLSFLIIHIFNIGNLNSAHTISVFYNFKNNLLQTIVDLTSRIAQDILWTTLTSFGHIFTLPGLDKRSSLYVFLIMGFTIFIGFLFFLRLRKQDPETPSNHNGIDKVTLGYLFISGIWLLLAGIPIWVTNLQINQDTTSTRLSLPFMPGACLFVVALISIALRPIAKNIAFSALVVFSMTFQFLNGYTFVGEKKIQESFLWQLSQRMPAIEPGTGIISNGLGLNLNGENSDSAMINWMYTPQTQTAGLDLQYYFYQYPEHLSRIISQVHSGTTETYHEIIGSFTPKHIIAIYFHPHRCLRILDPNLDPINPDLPKSLQDLAGINATEAIQSNRTSNFVPRPPQEIFGNKMPPDDWCAAFEEASLAAQNQDWSQVTVIGNRAFERGWNANDAMELLVFIEGYGRQGDWKKSTDLLHRAFGSNPEDTQLLCRFMEHLKKVTLPSNEREFVLSEFGCILPNP
jgi:hypothetical protein